MPIHSDESGWVLELKSTTYATGVSGQGYLLHRYWGARLPFATDYPPPASAIGWASFDGPAQLLPEEYPAYAGTKYIEPCLKVNFPDGVRDTVLQLTSSSINDGRNPELVLHLHDAFYPFQLDLHYRIYEDLDLIERWAVVINTGEQPVTIERIFSAQWHLPRGEDYRLSHLSGRWLDEFHLQRDRLAPGVKVFESRRITTSHHAQPWFALDRGAADEDHGEVWFGLLQWSGNWKIAAEVTDFDQTRLGIGLNDWDFAWRLEPGQSFTTPAALGGYTPHGFGDASRRLHDFVRRVVLPHGEIIHKVLYNSWEATTFDVDVESQARLAELAAEMGIELFVMDDGWFEGRNDDRAGLGDWWPDSRKFPQGLAVLVEKVNALGMDFGLWVEPEMVNPDSQLYRQHPDWVIHFPNRARTEARNQFILNFARRDVQDCIFSLLDDLLARHNIAFIKWDMNRNVSEPGWPAAEGDPRELWVRYVQGLYRVWGKLRQRHPHVIWQSCSGGGGRADLGILRLADQVWVSDNTEATARLNIQEGYSHIFPANTMEAWVTDANAGRISLAFRFHTSMCGSLGVGGHLLHWSQAERKEAAQWISLYKEIRHIVQLGDQYRLRSAQEGPFSAVQYMSKDRSEGVLFAFRTHIPEPFMLPPLYLRGLEPEAIYEIEGEAEPKSGLAWMHTGMQLWLKDFESEARKIKRVGQ
ncbi:MAG TPA: alpha-galactosidase [Levilinea sp.]|nr:alpha-galactosidase [Levilinea sp.]